MNLSDGTRLGPYEIVAAIGAGGMGEVYRAKDTRLGRDVALKVLPAGFSADPDRLRRFEQEARATAALNHPNILAVYDIGSCPDAPYIVSELLDGQTLREVMAAGALPVSKAIDYARQAAIGLAAAHAKGIAHRDIKPENLFVTTDGRVKILDFGLAKLREPTSSGASVTRQADSTEAGVVLGTVAYMSPEQVRGQAADHRSDLFSLGVVLFEMLAGARPFNGDSVADTMSAILKEDAPDLVAANAKISPTLDRVVRHCLEKNPGERFQSAQDLAFALQSLTSGATTMAAAAAASLTVPSGARGWRERLAWATTVVALLVATATLLILRARPSQPASPVKPVMRVELNLPAGVELYTGTAQSAAVSPDGTRVAFVGVIGGVRQVYLRHLDQVEATPLRGTENAAACFFSPDGRAVGFLTTGLRLQKVSLDDGLVVPVAADTDFTGGGAWGKDDRITFPRAGGLWQVPAAGGVATQVTRLDTGKGELSHTFPTAVADGKVLLFSVTTGSGRGAAHIEALTLATGQRHVLVDPGISPMYAPSGHLIFFRDDALLAVPFDVDRLAVTGPPIRVVEHVALDTRGTPVAALSRAGTLVYAAGGRTSQIVWVSRQGVEQPVTDTPRPYANPQMAPDGHRVLVSASGDLWLQETARATFTRLTSNDTAGNSFPVWTPDGTRAIFRTTTGLQWIEADGSGRSQAIPGTSPNDFPSSVSPDGATLAFVRISADTSGDVYALSLKGDTHPHAVVKGPAYEGGAQFSPDGRWLAYASDESGAFQVYLRPFLGPDRRWPVSTQGGIQPRWNRNGKELFYRVGNKMMVVGVSTTPALVLSPPRVLFEQRYAFGSGTTIPTYDVSADGQRFVMVKDESGSGRLNVVLNLFDELKARVPTTK